MCDDLKNTLTISGAPDLIQQVCDYYEKARRRSKDTSWFFWFNRILPMPPYLHNPDVDVALLEEWWREKWGGCQPQDCEFDVQPDRITITFDTDAQVLADFIVAVSRKFYGLRVELEWVDDQDIRGVIVADGGLLVSEDTWYPDDDEDDAEAA